MKQSINSAYKKLKEILRNMNSVLVAYSGGTDSTMLLKVAQQILGERVIAATIQSPIFPATEFRKAKRFARQIGVRHVTVYVDIISEQNFKENPPRRCYYCKRKMFAELKKIAKEEKLQFVIDGTNLDDNQDFRPGLEANRELGIRSPIAEAGLTKTMVRKISKRLNLPTYNKPPLACLATRIPYKTEITVSLLEKIETLEKYLSRLGISQVRLRHHHLLARIEVPPGEIIRVIKNRDKIVKRFKKAGYKYITVDLEGYRSGSMNLMI